MKLSASLLTVAVISVLGPQGFGTLGGADAKAAELKLAHFASPRHPMQRFVFEPWAKELASKSNGELTVKMFPGGALGKGAQAQFKRASDGIADITWGIQGYTSNQFPRTMLIETPGLAPDAPTATKMIWGAMDLLLPEYKRVKLVGAWTSDSIILMTKGKAVRSVDDLTGMTIRAPSKLMGSFIRALNATPVTNLPGPRIYQAFERGVVDGVLTGASTIRSIKMHEIAKFYTLAPLSHSAMFLVMNKRSFDGLSSAHRELVQKTSGQALSVRAATAYQGAGKKSLDFVRKNGSGEIISLSATETTKWQNALAPLREKTIADAEAKGVPARKIIAAMEMAR